MDKTARDCLSEFLKICSKELQAGNCNLSEQEAAAIVDTFIKARRRELDPASEAAFMRRMAEGYLDLAGKVEKIESDINKNNVVQLKPKF